MSEPIAIQAPPTSCAPSEQMPPPAVDPAPARIHVWVSDPARAIELRDYLRRLGLSALANGCGTVEAEFSAGSELARAREEIDGYIDGWVKTNGVPVRLN